MEPHPNDDTFFDEVDNMGKMLAVRRGTTISQEFIRLIERQNDRLENEVSRMIGILMTEVMSDEDLRQFFHSLKDELTTNQ